MIDPTQENLIPIARAGEDDRLIRTIGRVTEKTIRRWAARGVRGRRLESVVVGGRRYTSSEAIERFIRPGRPGGANHVG